MRRIWGIWCMWSALLLSQQALPELLQALGALGAGSRLPCKGCLGLVPAPGLPLFSQAVELPAV